MAAVFVVECPECEKKFKPKGDVQGKKIKCPFCTHPFVVPAAKTSKAASEKTAPAGKPAKAVESKSKPEQAKPVAVVEAAAPAAANPAENLEQDHNPYGVSNQDLSIRCPNCAQEMADEHAIICTFCGYNTLTRSAGKTEKTLGITAQQHLIYLLPALGSATFAFCVVLYLLFYSLQVPYIVAGSWLSFLDSEALRMWSTVAWLFVIWAAGQFCFKKFIEKPMPDEVKID